MSKARWWRPRCAKEGSLPSREGSDLARALLAKAGADATAARELIGNEHVADSVIGFHAQQAVEKSLKAVLASRGARFERTHDLDRLLELLDEQGLDPPIDPDELTALTDYAVTFRYDEPIEEEPLDRTHTLEIVDSVESWARDLAQPPPDR